MKWGKKKIIIKSRHYIRVARTKIVAHKVRFSGECGVCFSSRTRRQSLANDSIRHTRGLTIISSRLVEREKKLPGDNRHGTVPVFRARIIIIFIYIRFRKLNSVVYRGYLAYFVSYTRVYILL